MAFSLGILAVVLSQPKEPLEQASYSNNNNQRYLVRVTLNSNKTKPVALISGSNWNLVLVFVEGGKPENPEKNPRSRDENQQQTQPTCDAGSYDTVYVQAL